MSTNNPKVAGYIPQHLYDSFVSFCNERKVSVSKGIALVFAGYFGVDYSVSHSVDNDKVNELLLRLQNLEEKFGSLPNNSTSELLSKIDTISTQLESLTQRIQAVELSVPSSSLPGDTPLEIDDSNIDSESILISESLAEIEAKQESHLQLSLLDNPSNQIDSELPSSLPSELVLENSDITDKDELLKTDLEEKSALLSSIQNELPTEQDTQEPFQIEASQTETVSADIDIKLLALRLGMKNSQSITNKKSQLSEEEFFWWTTSKDIDRIGWKPKKVGKQVYYKPIVLNEDSELLSKLLKWIKKNKVS